jgi:hypothetical protein
VWAGAGYDTGKDQHTIKGITTMVQLHKRRKNTKTGIYFRLGGLMDVDTGSQQDEVNYRSGNYHLNPIPAQNDYLMQSINRALKDASIDACIKEDTKIDWNDNTQNKYFAYYDDGIKYAYTRQQRIPNVIYFPSHVSTLEAYNDILGEKINSYMQYDEQDYYSKVEEITITNY